MNRDNRNENNLLSEDSLPEFDLGMPTMAIPPEQRESTKQREAQVSLALLFLVAGILLLTLFLRRGSVSDSLASRADDISDATRELKFAFALQRDGVSSATSVSTKRKVLVTLRKRVLEPDASPGDIRRYVIALGALETPHSPEILRTVTALLRVRRHASATPNPAEQAREILSGRLVMPPEQEVLLWKRLYGKEALRLSPSELVDLRTRLEQMELGWYESLALEQLYARGGMERERQEAHRQALASAEPLARLLTLQYLAVLAGLLIWCYLGMKQLHRLKTPRPYQPEPKQQREPLLTYTARVKTFGLYLGFPLLFSLLLPLLRSYRKHPTPLQAVRMDGMIYLLESGLILGCCLYAIRHLLMREKREAGLREIAVQLGFCAPQPLTLIGRGALTYVLILSPMALAAVVSNRVFQNYSTPAHPLSLSFMLLRSPWDWVLLFMQTAVVAPLVEETLFRGVLYPALREKWGQWRGIVLTSTIFAILHPNMPAGFLPLFVLGGGMALLYERNRSLLPAMVLHAINNGVILFMEFLIMAK